MRLRLLACAVLTLLSGIYVWQRLRIETSIVDFLPDDRQAQLLRVARQLSTAPQSRVAVLTLSAPNHDSHRAAAKQLAAKLAKSPRVQWVRAGLDQTDQQAFYELFFPARVGLSELPGGAGPVPDDVLRERVAALRERLSSPLGAITRELAPRDPLGLFEEYLGKLARTQGELSLVDGQLVTRDGGWSVLFVALRASPFLADEQRAWERELSQHAQALSAAAPSLRLEWTSVGRYARAAEQSIRDDIARISLFSTLGILLLYLAVFRSLREPLLVTLPIVFGSVVSLAVCQLLFGFVHGLSLAFGTSIIGVAEDFSTHYFSHRREAPQGEDNEALMRRLWPGMLLGGATTVLGVLSLVVSGFPGLAQMAVFGAVGVLSALLCTRYVLPVLTRAPRAARPPSPARVATLRTLSRRPLAMGLLVGVPVLLGAVGALQLRFEDGVAALRTHTPALDAENGRVQNRLGRGGSAGRAIVALGADDEQALRVAEQVHARLTSTEGAQAGTRSVVELLPSLATQQRRAARLRDDATLPGRLRAVLQEQGFVPEAFQPFFDDLQGNDQALPAARVLNSPLASMVVPFRAPMPGGVAYLTAPSSRDAAVATRVAGISGALYVDQEALYAAAYGSFRERALSLMAWGALLVFVVIWWRYRSFRFAVLGMLPALLGAGGAMGMLGLLGVPVSFLNAIAILLVLSMGVDYGIYALESREGDDAASTLGSVLLAAATSVLSFGLLGLSQNPALRAIGLTVAIGLLFCVLTSPVALVLSRRSQ